MATVTLGWGLRRLGRNACAVGGEGGLQLRLVADEHDVGVPCKQLTSTTLKFPLARPRVATSSSYRCPKP
jgi:hypothetical protein